MSPKNVFTTPVSAKWLAVCMLVVSVSPSVEAAPDSMSVDEIMDLARVAVGHGYYRGQGSWTSDRTEVGECVWHDDKTGEARWGYTGSEIGADCSGFVAKAWQVPDPSPLDKNRHPYSTSHFLNSEAHWTRVADRADVRKGDAFVYRKNGAGHIVLVDERVDNERFHIYHAAGCARGIVHDTSKLIGPEYVAIRRNLLASSCETNTCGDYGECGDDGGCVCERGYDGDACDTCAPGYEKFPVCADTGVCPGEVVALGCGAQITIEVDGDTVGQGGCDETSAALAREQPTFRFSGPSTGHAEITIDADGDVTALLLRDECDAGQCIDSAHDRLEFDFARNDEFYIALAAEQRTRVTLSVSCRANRDRWIGDACRDDADCNFSRDGQNGYCYRDDEASFCSMPCPTSLCPDVPNAATTFCISDPTEPEHGMCVSKADPLNDSCAAVDGTRAEMAVRFGSSKQATACVPHGIVGGGLDISCAEGLRDCISPDDPWAGQCYCDESYIMELFSRECAAEPVSDCPADVWGCCAYIPRSGSLGECHCWDDGVLAPYADGASDAEVCARYVAAQAATWNEPWIPIESCPTNFSPSGVMRSGVPEDVSTAVQALPERLRAPLERILENDR